MGKLYAPSDVFEPYHYTATNCAKLLKKYITPDASVADVGTGTGILALAAKRYGAGHVLATDIDPKAVECSKINCAGTDIEFMTASLLEGVNEKFDIIIANLYANAAVEFLQYAGINLADNGVLILTLPNEVSFLLVEEYFTIIDQEHGPLYSTYALKH